MRWHHRRSRHGHTASSTKIAITRIDSRQGGAEPVQCFDEYL